MPRISQALISSSYQKKSNKSRDTKEQKKIRDNFLWGVCGDVGLSDVTLNILGY